MELSNFAANELLVMPEPVNNAVDITTDLASRADGLMAQFTENYAPTAGMPPGHVEQVVIVPSSSPLFGKTVLLGAGVGYLVKGVTGAIVGGLLGLLWKR